MPTLFGFNVTRCPCRPADAWAGEKESLLNKQLIMVADDIPANLRIAKNVLGAAYTVATAASAEKLFALLEHNKPALILLDIDMPGMNGYEAIAHLKSHSDTRDIPVLFLTARQEAEEEQKGRSLGAVDYIVKPYAPAFLLERVRIHLSE
jgi:putative two-component system response regulator